MFISFTAYGQTEKSDQKTPETQIVEASCGQCNFDLSGGGCALAVKIDGKAYFVGGAELHDHGDAHAGLGRA